MPHGQANLRGNLRAVDPGCLLFLELDRTDGTRICINYGFHPSSHPIGSSSTRLPYSLLCATPLCPFFLFICFFPLFFSLSPTRASANFPYSNRPMEAGGWRVARIKKEEEQKRRGGFPPRVLPECSRRTLSATVEENREKNGAIEFESASPSGKMTRSTLIAANSFVIRY